MPQILLPARCNYDGPQTMRQESIASTGQHLIPRATCLELGRASRPEPGSTPEPLDRRTFPCQSIRLVRLPVLRKLNDSETSFLRIALPNSGTQTCQGPTNWKHSGSCPESLKRKTTVRAAGPKCTELQAPQLVGDVDASVLT